MGSCSKARSCTCTQESGKRIGLAEIEMPRASGKIASFERPQKKSKNFRLAAEGHSPLSLLAGGARYTYDKHASVCEDFKQGHEII